VILAASLALAACPCEGFRVTNLGAGRSAFTRLALVKDLDGAFYPELTLGGQTWAGRFGFAAELAGTAGFGENWEGYGLGNLILDSRFLVDRGRRHGLGLRVKVPAGGWLAPESPVTWWGTVPEATVAFLGAAVAYEGSAWRLGWHAHAGWHAGLYWGTGWGPDDIDAAAAIAWVQPVAGDWSMVSEFEAAWGMSPLHLRALARYAQPGVGPRWTVDAGLAAPLLTIWADPTLQVIAQVRHSF